MLAQHCWCGGGSVASVVVVLVTKFIKSGFKETKICNRMKYISFIILFIVLSRLPEVLASLLLFFSLPTR